MGVTYSYRKNRRGIKSHCEKKCRKAFFPKGYFMSGRRFYLWQRGRSGIFYAELIDKVTGQKLTARRTGMRHF
jgi:hypothetical protein